MNYSRLSYVLLLSHIENLVKTLSLATINLKIVLGLATLCMLWSNVIPVFRLQKRTETIYLV